VGTGVYFIEPVNFRTGINATRKTATNITEVHTAFGRGKDGWGKDGCGNSQGKATPLAGGVLKELKKKHGEGSQNVV